jgi:hypothetical protein
MQGDPVTGEETVEAGVEPPGWAERLRPARVPGALWVLGGVALVVAGLFKWLVIRFPPSFGQRPLRLSGMDLNDGRLTMGVGAAVALLTILLGVARPAGWRLLTSSLAVLGGLLVLTVTVTLTLRMPELVNEGNRASAAIGVWIAVAGAGLMALAAGADLVTASRAERARPDVTGAGGDSNAEEEEDSFEVAEPLAVDEDSAGWAPAPPSSVDDHEEWAPRPDPLPGPSTSSGG